LELVDGVNTVPNTLGAKLGLVQFWQNDVTSAGGLNMKQSDSSLVIDYAAYGDDSYELKAVVIGECESQTDLLVNIYSPTMVFEHGLSSIPDMVTFWSDNGDGTESLIAQGVDCTVNAVSITINSAQAFSGLHVKLVCFNGLCGNYDIVSDVSIVPDANSFGHSLGAVPYIVQFWQENTAGNFTLFQPGGLPLTIDSSTVDLFNGGPATYDNIYISKYRTRRSTI